jgi:hypothetical protein
VSVVVDAVAMPPFVLERLRTGQAGEVERRDGEL